MRRGLVLEGGGAKGAFHCGAVMALYDSGYTFDGVAGTSIGAINAALIAQDENYDSLYKFWDSVTASLFTDFEDEKVENLFNKELTKSTVAYWSRQALKIIRNLGIPTDKLIPFLKESISEEKVRRSKMDLAMVTYSLSDRAPVEIFSEDIPVGELHNYILASAYYPAFRLKPINGKYYIDGGICNNLPISLLEKRGYDEIFAIRTMSKMPYRLPEREDIKVHYICPTEDLGKTVALSHKIVMRKIQLGYFDAKKFLNDYGGFKFYIDGSNTEVAEYFYESAKRNYIKLAGDLKLSPSASESEVLNALRATLLKFYEEKTDKFEDAVMNFAEEYAELYGFEKFRLYTPKAFFEKLREAANSSAVSEPRLGFLMREKIKKDNIFYQLMKD